MSSNQYNVFIDANAIISIAEETWEPEQLPYDMRRLASNVYDLLTLCGKKITFLERELSQAKNKDLISAKSVTPHQAVLGILIRTDPDNLIKGLKKANRRILITRELKDVLAEIPKEIENSSLKLKETVVQ